MSRLRSIVYMAAGAAAISYGAYEYSARFSNESIWQRQSVQIERTYRNERPPGSKTAPPEAEANRHGRYEELRAGLSGLADASGEERCRFEARFERKLATGSSEAAAESLANESYEPFSQCTAGSRLKDGQTSIPAIGGLLVLLYGIYRFIKSFSRDPGVLGKDGEKRRKEMANDRRETLLAYGLGHAHAHTITEESMRVQSVHDVLHGNHLATFVISVLQNYGFSKPDVQRILLAYPGVLNRTPEEICDRLSQLEDGGVKTQDEVRETVLRLPAMLGAAGS
jgi:hypothetical protein